MKKIFFALIALLCSGTSTNAQVCKISQTNDNVEIYSCYLTDSNSTVSVTVGNDSQNNSANVTVEVEVTYKTSGGTTKKQTYIGRGLARANTTTEIKISIQPQIDNFKAVSVSPKGISGTKCM